MASKIKGIVVDIGGNTGPLEASLKDVNKTSRDLQGELKQVERLLKLDPQNTELLAQKQKLLSESVENTKEKLTRLKAAEKDVQEQVKQGKINEEQYRAFQREIAKTEAELKKTEDQAKKTGSEFDALGKKSDGVNDFMKGATVAAVGAGVGLVGMAVKAGQAADDINTMAKVTGLSTEEIQKFQYASERIDVSMDTLTGSMAKLTKNMSNAKKGNEDLQSTFGQLGVSILDSNGNLRDNNDVFQETIAALGQVSNETERDAMAMKIFGKSAQELNPLILGGADDLKKYGEEAEAAGLILSQDALDGANKFNDGVDKLKATAMSSFGVVGGEIAENLIPFIEKLSEILTNVVTWIIDNKELVLTTIAAVGAGLVAWNIAVMIQKFVGFTKGLEGATLAQKLFNLAMSANPIALIVTLIAGLIAALVVLWNTNEDFRNSVLEIFGGIKEFFISFDDFLTNIFTTDWTKNFGSIGEVLNAFFANAQNIWESIKRIFSGIIDFVAGVFTGDWGRAWEGVKNIFGGIMDGLGAVIKAPLNTVIGLINMAIGQLNKISFTAPDWVPFVGGKHFGVNLPKINYLWKGGIVDSPTLFGNNVIGDKFQGVGSNKEAIIPLDEMYRNLDSIVSSKLSDSSSIILYTKNETILDGEVISEKTTKKVIKNITKSQKSRSIGKGGLGLA